MAVELPQLAVPITDFIAHVNKFPRTQSGVAEAVEPFKAFESKLREIYAQQPNHPAAIDNHLVSVFENEPVTVRARDLTKESPSEKDKYLLPLKESARRKDGSLATVQSLKDFKTNFNLFSESSLSELDWSNVVCAGSATATALLPVPAPHNESKRALRNYYHEILAPASDVDLFLYGLTEAQAAEKIKQIETKIRDSILAETTCVRTRNVITIVSQYPTRHVQVVIRLYKSISEILTGFDVDCSCVAYDGQQVWMAPRALAAFMTQTNTIDLTRRSPSYENRLSKYSHRGFEVHWAAIDRSRVDPTVFERSFSRVQGLARLLVLEKLPYPNDRDAYLAKRRAERGRPPLPWNARSRFELQGNIKEAQPDDVAEWVEANDVSNYHTIVIPYGPKFHAKRIEKLLFTKDLLLNAEWNKPKDREANLHRHPAFFGSVDDVLYDCCGYCPKPITDEDLAAFEEEKKIYISGNITFLKDDPGRQSIGSFNPITVDNYTEMAYIGNTEKLCQSIVDLDLEAVRDWFSSVEVVDPNRRDHTGRTPLHLAVMCSTPEIVQCLIEHGARLVARLYNGMTALHLAAHRGEVQMVKDILDKSDANADEGSKKEDARKHSRRSANAANIASELSDAIEGDQSDKDLFDADEDFEDDEKSDDVTEGSFVKVGDTAGMDSTEDDDEPDVYDVDVLAWDSPLSPLHLAILAGHMDVIELLVSQYGADVLLPAKVMDSYHRGHANAAILTISLALELPLQQANETVKRLLAAGATSTQADINHISALHYALQGAKIRILETMKSASPSTFVNGCNFIALDGHTGQVTVRTPLLSAIRTGRPNMVASLVNMGARTEIDFESFVQAYKRKFGRAPEDPEEMKKIFQRSVEQPIILAFHHEMLEFVDQLIDGGAEVNVLPPATPNFINRTYYSSWNSTGKSLLDLVTDRISDLKDYVLGAETTAELTSPAPLGDDGVHLDHLEEGSYARWTAFHNLLAAKAIKQYQMEERQKEVSTNKRSDDEMKKIATITSMIGKLRKLALKLEAKGAKSFGELYPDIEKEPTGRNGRGHFHYDNIKIDNAPYRTKMSFRVTDLTPEKETNYIKLFEAAWAGEQETVKSLCLRGDHPLQIAVQDLSGFSPFSLAVMRGHFELALLIIEIAKAQYQPPDKTGHYQYSIRTGNYYGDKSDDDEDESGSDTTDEIRLQADFIDETFTVDDVVRLAANVKSTVSPSTVEEMSNVNGSVRGSQVQIGNHTKQSWAWFNAVYANARSNRESLVRFAISTDNMVLLKFLIKLGNDSQCQGEADGLTRVDRIGKDCFNLAMDLGRVEMIGVMIKSTGFGFPLQKVFQNSGIQIDEKPEYYQGLSIRGKKRQDWAEAGRAESDLGIPLLAACFEGNLETAEYFMSDAPLRRYLEFAETFKTDKRIRALVQMSAGIKGTLESWLTTRNHLALHIGVLSIPNRDGNQPTFDFLLEKMPQSMESPSASGKTPLHLAFEVGRFHAAKKLIAQGADQTTKDRALRNILHTMLDTIAADKPKLLRSVLEMLDSGIVRALGSERCSAVKSTGNTPLAVFLAHVHNQTGWEESVSLVLSLSGGKDLEIMDGAGDYPIHTTVRRGHLELVKFIVEYRPSLLYWENATGMTVSDVVTTSYLRYQIDHPPRLRNDSARNIKDKPAHEFNDSSSHDDEDDKDARSQEWRMYYLINHLMAKYPGKRKLVSLYDANEVAKRLALQQQKQNDEARRREALGSHAVAGSGGSSNFNARGEVIEVKPDARDEVDEYLARAKGYTKWDEMLWRQTQMGETTEEEWKTIEMEYGN